MNINNITNLQKFKGKFIAIEGIDGSGKSTQSKLLAAHFTKLGLNVTLTREPGGTDKAEILRNVILNNKFANITEMLLFQAARYEHVANLIKPQLQQDYLIICDRFIDSTFVYQGLNGVDQELINTIHQLTSKILPDLTILMDADISLCQERLSNRKDNNYYDELKFDQLKIIKEHFHHLAHNSKKHIVIRVDHNDEMLIHQAIIKNVINFFDK
ncbi:dTMP kinase [Rickettsiales endosymbiont of Stachyamoeba lipophora]|uniref:dTMP kinase n=1 Tax=Rickettsiales endosymbiont of Stachyamoeba lipophora TaxID=2486578 RepID=UPI000F6505D6|nr:dTMP kinase [Rickettsiales endosymbiont of Stachyamoeba lipophora]AZL15562.1 dTMP kinase [Rickettsiales endosymbiont of Stachyamoeba lipophora]